MAPLRFIDVSKVYPNGVEAVSHLSLDVEDGEFVVLVGPSGCGKTTALRMVAGLEDVTDGEIEIGGRVVNDLSPRERDIAMVFQNYALYPHMTVAENIGFSLEHAEAAEGRGRPEGRGCRRVCSASPTSCDRKPAQLSGGQRQRVAMGRAIVREPAAFLMDEPLSNLDAKLRVHMRSEVSRIQRHLGVATLYVTHDQVEAMTMGDRVAVMRAGKLQQYAAPKHLYDRPANLFVAAFIGSPAMNLYQATVDAEGRSIAVGDQRLSLPPDLTDEAVIGRYRGERIVVGIRPEDLGDAALGDGSATGQRLHGTVDLVEELGAEKLVHFHIDAERLSASDELLAGDEEETEGLLDVGEIGTATASAGVARIASRGQITADQAVDFTVDTARLHLFDPDEGGSLRVD